MNRTFFYLLLLFAGYFGLKYWRLQNELKKQQRKNNLPNQSNPFKKINWDAQDVEFEEIKDQE